MADSNPEILPLIPVNLATVCIESYLYGVFSVLYAASAYLLVQRGKEKIAAEGLRGSTSSVYKAPMFIAASIMFCTVSAHWSFTAYRVFEAFVNFDGGKNPLLYYADIALASEVAKSALLVVTVLVSDAMIIYRLYIIWGYNKWIVIPPILLWCGLIVVGAGVCWRFSQYELGDAVYTGLTGRWITSDCIFTIATNAYCTLCISYRVWRTRIRTRSSGAGGAHAHLLGALAILVESAALHTAWNLVFLAAFRLRIPFQFTAIDLWAPISGIAFMLINLRVALGWAHRAHASESGAGGSAVGVTPALPLCPASPASATPPLSYGPPRVTRLSTGLALAGAPSRSPTSASAKFSYRSERDPTRVPERVCYGDDVAWQSQPWVVHALPHSYATAVVPPAWPLEVGAARAADDGDSPIEGKFGIGIGEAV